MEVGRQTFIGGAEAGPYTSRTEQHPAELLNVAGQVRTRFDDRAFLVRPEAISNLHFDAA
jgi:hypothetical protein